MWSTLVVASSQRRWRSGSSGVILGAGPQDGLHIRRGEVTDFQGQFLVGGITTQLLGQGALDAQNAGDRLEQVHRDADGARLLGDRAVDGLADPPGGIGAEFEAAAWVELVDRPQQAQVALLDQVQEGDAAPQVALGHADHQPQVGADDGRVGLVGAGADESPPRGPVRLQAAGCGRACAGRAGRGASGGEFSSQPA